MPRVSATLRENRCQLLCRNNFKLGISTFSRGFVRSPAAELRRMAEAVSLHVIVGDLHHQFGSQWFPSQVLALTPATLASRHSTHTVTVTQVRPTLPRVRGERVFAIRLEKFSELLPLLRTEARTNSYMLQCTGVIKEAQQ